MSKNSVFLLLGPETGLKDDFIKKCFTALEKKLGEAPEKYSYYPYDTDIKEIVSLLQNSSLFSSHKVVTIKKVDELKKSDADILASYCKNPSSETTLFLTSDQTNVDKKLTAAVPKSNKKIFWELFESQKTSWIVSYFRQRNMSIQKEAIDFLLEMVENNTEDLRKECDKIIFYFSDKKHISQEDIDSFIYHSKEENVFSLFEKMMKGSFPLSLEVFQKILLESDSNVTGLISGLLWQFKKLLLFKEFSKQHYSSNEIFNKINIRSKKSQKVYSEGARFFTLDDVRRIIMLSQRFDKLMRWSKKDVQKILFQLYLYHCIVKKGYVNEQLLADKLFVDIL